MTFLSLGTNLEVIKKILHMYNQMIVSNNCDKLSHYESNNKCYLSLSFYQPIVFRSTELFCLEDHFRTFLGHIRKGYP